MGFEEFGTNNFRIPVSDTQAYRQFGNAVVVPVVRAVAQLMKPCIEEALTHGMYERPVAHRFTRRAIAAE